MRMSVPLPSGLSAEQQMSPYSKRNTCLVVIIILFKHTAPVCDCLEFTALSHHPVVCYFNTKEVFEFGGSGCGVGNNWENLISGISCECTEVTFPVLVCS